MNDELKAQIAALPPETVWVWATINGVQTLFTGSSLSEAVAKLNVARNG